MTTKTKPPQMRVFGPFIGVLAPGEQTEVGLPEGVDAQFHEVVIASVKGTPVETLGLHPDRASIRNSSDEPAVYALLVVPRWGVRAATLPWKDIIGKIAGYVQDRRTRKLR